MPYHIGGVIPEENLINWAPEDFKNRFEIDVRIFFSEVINVSPENNKSITVKKKSGKFMKKLMII